MTNGSLLKSASGVQQGDPLGPLLFSLALQKLIKKLHDRLLVVDPSGVDLNLWYLDDGFLVLNRALVPEAISLLESEGPKLGLYISANIPKPKCEIYWPSGQADLQSVKGLSVSDGGPLVLGSPIGSVSFMQSTLDAKLEKLKENHDALMHLDHAQSQLTLLRFCLSACKVMYLLRTVPPEFSLSFAQKTDDLVRTALASVMAAHYVPSTSMAYRQAVLPVRMGGLGLTSAVDLVHPAYLGSLVGSATLLMNMPIQVPVPRNLVDDFFASPGVIDSSNTRDLFDPSNCGARIQSTLSGLVHEANFQNLISTPGICDRDVIRLNNVSATQANAWLRALPNPSFKLAMPSIEFRIALNHLLGLAVYPRGFTEGRNGESVPVREVCRSCNVMVDDFGDHDSSCREGGRIHRHNALVNTVAGLMKDAGYSGLKTEPENLVPNDPDARPADILWSSGSPPFYGMVDVTVTSSLNSSNKNKSLVEPGYAVLTAQKRKDDNFPLCLRQDRRIRFYPLALDVFGGFTPFGLNFLRTLSLKLSTKQRIPLSVATDRVFQRVSIVLQYENAVLLDKRSRYDNVLFI